MKFAKRPPHLEVIFDRYRDAVYFITFCTHRRKPVLATEFVHRAFIEFCFRGLERGIVVGRYVIMPDHVHLFVTGNDDFRVGDWIKLLKQMLGKALGHSATNGRLWQEGFFDHVLRNDESMSQKWGYIRGNPVRAGLAGRAEDWPSQGEIAYIDRV